MPSKQQINYTASTVLKYSPRKARLIINVIRRKTLSDALDILISLNKGQTKKIQDLLKSAYTNLSLTSSDFDSYIISRIVAEEAQRYYRVMPRARGSAAKIRRRFSRIKVLLEPKVDKKVN